jgi:hypothetical protein
MPKSILTILADVKKRALVARTARHYAITLAIV